MAAELVPAILLGAGRGPPLCPSLVPNQRALCVWCKYKPTLWDPGQWQWPGKGKQTSAQIIAQLHLGDRLNLPLCFAAGQLTRYVFSSLSASSILWIHLDKPRQSISAGHKVQEDLALQKRGIVQNGVRGWAGQWLDIARPESKAGCVVESCQVTPSVPASQTTGISKMMCERDVYHEMAFHYNLFTKCVTLIKGDIIILIFRLGNQVSKRCSVAQQESVRLKVENISRLQNPCVSLPLHFCPL